jgi:hypothetical protein
VSVRSWPSESAFALAASTQRIYAASFREVEVFSHHGDHSFKIDIPRAGGLAFLDEQLFVLHDNIIDVHGPDGTFLRSLSRHGLWRGDIFSFRTGLTSMTTSTGMLVLRINDDALAFATPEGCLRPLGCGTKDWVIHDSTLVQLVGTRNSVYF